MISFMKVTIMKTLWIIVIIITVNALLLIFQYLPPDYISTHIRQFRKPRNMGLQLEIVENENLTEIFMTGFDSSHSFASLMTVIILFYFYF